MCHQRQARSGKAAACVPPGAAWCRRWRTGSMRLELGPGAWSLLPGRAFQSVAAPWGWCARPSLVSLARTFAAPHAWPMRTLWTRSRRIGGDWRSSTWPPRGWRWTSAPGQSCGHLASAVNDSCVRASLGLACMLLPPSRRRQPTLTVQFEAVATRYTCQREPPPPSYRAVLSISPPVANDFVATDNTRLCSAFQCCMGLRTLWRSTPRVCNSACSWLRQERSALSRQRSDATSSCPFEHDNRHLGCLGRTSVEIYFYCTPG